MKLLFRYEEYLNIKKKISKHKHLPHSNIPRQNEANSILSYFTETRVNYEFHLSH